VRAPADLVGPTWLRTVPDFPAGTGVANALPEPWEESTGRSQWDDGATPVFTFVTCRVLPNAGTSTDDFLESSAVFRLDCWARPREQGGKPPWARANALAELVRVAAQPGESGIVLEFPQSYDPVKVIRVGCLVLPYAVNRPVRPGTDRSAEAGALARYAMNIVIDYV
jgi:hypothetical protein